MIKPLCYKASTTKTHSKTDAQHARAKLMEAAYTVSVVHGNHMTCSAGHAGTLALKAELTAVGDSPLAAAEAAVRAVEIPAVLPGGCCY